MTNESNEMFGDHPFCEYGRLCVSLNEVANDVHNIFDRDVILSKDGSICKIYSEMHARSELVVVFSSVLSPHDYLKHTKQTNVVLHGGSCGRINKYVWNQYSSMQDALMQRIGHHLQQRFTEHTSFLERNQSINKVESKFVYKNVGVFKLDGDKQLELKEVSRFEYSNAGPRASCVFVGHGVGGCMAMIAALDISMLFTLANIEIYTFGSPKLGDSTFCDSVSRFIPQVFCITHKYDTIPRLPISYKTMARVDLDASIVPVKSEHRREKWIGFWYHLLSRYKQHVEIKNNMAFYLQLLKLLYSQHSRRPSFIGRISRRPTFDGSDRGVKTSRPKAT